MIENQYYDETLGINGTAEELARFGIQYTDDFSDEALEKIIEILKGEGMETEAIKVCFELESRRELQNGMRDLGRMKAWAMDGIYQLLDEEDNDTFTLSVIQGDEKIVISVTGKPDEEGIIRGNAVSIPLNEFYALTAKKFDEYVNSVWFYATECE